MASEKSSSYCEPTNTRDRVLIQDYGQYLDSTTRSLALPTKGKEDTKKERLLATYDLFQTVNWAKFSGKLLVNNITADFSALGGSFLAQGGFFQTRHFPGQRVAKYPLIPNDTGVLPKSTYESLLKELRILCHAPLKEHENIVQLSSIQWARLDPVKHSWIPVLLLEEARHGSLQQYVASEKPGIETCLQLSQEIGSGLQALHASGVVHGDLKFQNVLVFDLGDGRVRAKLSDYGGSVIKGTQHRTVTLTTGTPPWTSPEHNEPVPSKLLHGTDTYAYGLLVWRLCLRGQHPFDGQDSEEIWRRKKNDLILSEALLSLEERYQKAMLLGGQAASGARFQLYKLSVSIPRRCLQHCLSASIDSRDLDKAVEALHYRSFGFPEEPAAPTKSGVVGKTELFATSRMAVNHLRLFDVPRSVKTMLYQCVTDITEISDAMDSSTGVDSWFQLSLQTLDGFGPADQSMTAAVSFMRKAALAGHGAAQVLLANLHEASGAVMDASTRSEYEKFLVKGVEKGSLLARIWLRGYDREALREAEQKQAQKVAGVSFGDQVDSRVRIENRIDALFGDTAFASMSPRLSAVPELASMWLSSRKNSHLHTGAAFGVSLDRFRPWLALLCRTINARDDDGNTALLLAVRFNHVDIAKLLLENGADASLPNKRGETVWHWLVAVEKLEDTIELVKLLKKTGGNVLDATAKPASGPIDIFGISHGGTALHWAVELGMTGLARTLVSCGADIQHSFNGARPVDIAIRRNRFEILRVFLEELRQRGEELGQLPLPFTSDEAGEVSARAWFTNYVAHAIAFHPFHERLVYGGKGWADALRQTLLVLREFGLALKVPISALPQLLQSTGGSTAILKLLAEEDFLERSSDQANFWADVAETIIRTCDTTNVLYAIERIRACSPDGRLPNAEKLLDICTESFSCDRAVVEAIAAEGINMDFPTLQSRTPLTGAVLERNFEIASALIEHGADVNAMWKPIYPGAPDKEHPEVNILYEHLTSNLDMALAPLEFLLEPLHPKKDSVPSFIVVPGEKKTALHLACRSANPLIVDYLLEKFHTPYHLDYVDYGGFTALHYAVFYGHVEVARKLCQKRARVDILAGDESLEPEDRRNALDYCHRLGGPNASDLHDSYGTSRGLEDVHLGRLEISKMLVRERQAVRTVGSTDLDDMVWSVRLCFYAAQKNMTRLLKAALEELRNDPSCGMSWQEALDELLVDAAISGQAGTTKLLIDYGANVNQVRPGDEDLTLLHQVVVNQEAESAYQLLRAGAKVNAYDKAGRTPLMYGLRSQDLATCRVLKHFGGMATLDWGSTAQILANNLGIGIEEAMAFLEGENLHMDVKLIGEPSDDDTEDEGQDDVEDEEVDKEEHEGETTGKTMGQTRRGTRIGVGRRMSRGDNNRSIGNE